MHNGNCKFYDPFGRQSVFYIRVMMPETSIKLSNNDKPDGWYRKFDKPAKNRNIKR